MAEEKKQLAYQIKQHMKRHPKRLPKLYQTEQQLGYEADDQEEVKQAPIKRRQVNFIEENKQMPMKFKRVVTNAKKVPLLSYQQATEVYRAKVKPAMASKPQNRFITV